MVIERGAEHGRSAVEGQIHSHHGRGAADRGRTGTSVRQGGGEYRYPLPPFRKTAPKYRPRSKPWVGNSWLVAGRSEQPNEVSNLLDQGAVQRPDRYTRSSITRRSSSRYRCNRPRWTIGNVHLRVNLTAPFLLSKAFAAQVPKMARAASLTWSIGGPCDRAPTTSRTRSARLPLPA